MGISFDITVHLIVKIFSSSHSRITIRNMSHHWSDVIRADYVTVDHASPMWSRLSHTRRVSRQC